MANETVVPEDDDFLRDVEPEEHERRAEGYRKAKKEAERARRRLSDSPASGLGSSDDPTRDGPEVGG